MKTVEGELTLPTRHRRFLKASMDARFVVLYGGASSAKSWSVAAWLLRKAFSEPHVGILVLRKTLPSVRTSCYRAVKHWLDEWQWPYHENKSELTIRAPSGSFLQFQGLDDVAKLKSVEGINYVWIEEATEITEQEFLQLHIRARAHNRDGRLNQIFLTFNPVNPIANGWLVDVTKQAPEGTLLRSKLKVLHCTHTHNPFLSDEEHLAIEALADADDEYNKIYRLGQWATPTGVIYDNWDIVEEIPPVDDYGYGLDFGYANPTALIWCGIKDDTDLYLREAIYETHLHNQDLIARLGEEGIEQGDVIVADSAEPAYIDEISDAGYNVHPCVKTGGQGDKSFVRTGINRVKRYRIHIHAESTNLIGEIGSYKWRARKDESLLDEPVKFMDHAMDAVRYYVGSRPEPVVTEIIQMPEWVRAALAGAL